MLFTSYFYKIVWQTQSEVCMLPQIPVSFLWTAVPSVRSVPTSPLRPFHGKATSGCWISPCFGPWRAWECTPSWGCPWALTTGCRGKAIWLPGHWWDWLSGVWYISSKASSVGLNITPLFGSFSFLGSLLHFSTNYCWEYYLINCFQMKF